MHPISLVVWLLLSLYVQGEIPSPACPSLSGAFTSFLLVIQYLHGSPELSGLLQLPVKKPYALSPHISMFPIPGPWSYCFMKHFNICLIVGFFLNSSRSENFPFCKICPVKHPVLPGHPVLFIQYIWIEAVSASFSSITAASHWF